MERIDGLDRETLSEMAEAILLSPDGLPNGIETTLVTLRQMLDKAVQGVGAATPVPPVYGKIAAPESDAENENILLLRPDVAVLETERLIELSPRQEGDYVVVPQVVQQGGHHE